MVIRESLEILKDESSIEEFRKEIDLLKSFGYEIFKEYEDRVIFYQRNILIN